MPLILGTAEFNPKGYAGTKCPSKKEITKILHLAWEGGIRTLDCAEAYNCYDPLNPLYTKFHRIWKNRERVTYRRNYYHYKQTEKRLEGITHASVYTLDQLMGLQSAIVPVNLNNTTFTWQMFKTPLYFRSVFDRGLLLKQGYSVRGCLKFVKKFPNDGVIVGVKSAKELEEILKVW